MARSTCSRSSAWIVGEEGREPAAAVRTGEDVARWRKAIDHVIGDVPAPGREVGRLRGELHRLLVLAQPRLHACAPAALHQQQGDERRLEQHHGGDGRGLGSGTGPRRSARGSARRRPGGSRSSGMPQRWSSRQSTNATGFSGSGSTTEAGATPSSICFAIAAACRGMVSPGNEKLPSAPFPTCVLEVVQDRHGGHRSQPIEQRERARKDHPLAVAPERTGEDDRSLSASRRPPSRCRRTRGPSGRGS